MTRQKSVLLQDSKSALVFWPDEQDVGEMALRVIIQLEDGVAVELPWRDVVHDLTSSFDLGCGEPQAPLTPWERYLVDNAGWDLLFERGIVPTVWGSPSQARRPGGPLRD